MTTIDSLIVLEKQDGNCGKYTPVKLKAGENITLDRSVVNTADLCGNIGSYSEITISSSSDTIASECGGISVKDFGAKGDGATNDRTAIQNAINYAVANNLNTVCFPSGTYLVSGEILLYNNITILGNGIFSTLIKAFNTQPDYSLFTGNHVSGISIKNLRIDGNNLGATFSPTNNGNGLDLSYSSNISLENIYIRDCAYIGVRLGDSSGTGSFYGRNISMQNIWVEDCEGGIVLGENCENVRGNDIFIKKTKDDGLCMGANGSVDVHFSNVHIDNSDISIARNGSGISILGVSRASLTNFSIKLSNTVATAGFTLHNGIRLSPFPTDVNAHRDVVISNGIVEGLGYSSAVLGSIIVEYYDDVHFNNVIVKGFRENGVYITNSNKVYWNNSEIKNNNQSATPVGSAILLTANNDVKFNNVYLGDDQGAPTQAFGVFTNSTTGMEFTNCNFVGNTFATTPVAVSGGTEVVMINNKGYNPRLDVVNTNVSGAITINRFNGDVFDYTLTGNITVTFTTTPEMVKGETITLRLKQGGVGGYTYTATAGHLLAGGAITLTVAVGKLDIIKFIYDGTNWTEMSRSQNI